MRMVSGLRVGFPPTHKWIHTKAKIPQEKSFPVDIREVCDAPNDCDLEGRDRQHPCKICLVNGPDLSALKFRNAGRQRYEHSGREGYNRGRHGHSLTSADVDLRWHATTSRRVSSWGKTASIVVTTTSQTRVFYSETVGSCNLSDGDMLQLIPQQQQQQQGPDPMDLNMDGSSKNPAGLISYIRNNPQQMSSLEQNNPPLAKCVQLGAPVAV